MNGHNASKIIAGAHIFQTNLIRQAHERTGMIVTYEVPIQSTYYGHDHIQSFTICLWDLYASRSLHYSPRGLQDRICESAGPGHPYVKSGIHDTSEGQILLAYRRHVRTDRDNKYCGAY